MIKVLFYMNLHRHCVDDKHCINVGCAVRSVRSLRSYHNNIILEYSNNSNTTKGIPNCSVILAKSEHEFYLCINCACDVSQPKSYCMNIFGRELDNIADIVYTCPLLTLTKWQILHTTHI